MGRRCIAATGQIGQWSSLAMNEQIPSWAYAAALSGLPRQTHSRLRRVLSQNSPEDAWHRVTQSREHVSGIPDNVLSAWRNVSQGEVVRMHDACVSENVVVAVRGDATYPMPLLADPHAPVVVFMMGNSVVGDNKRVGIVGTRYATQAGEHFARTLGRQLSEAGISVVSGLARGIDVNSHRGALAARSGAAPIAVVAGGPNVVYPKEHWREWQNIADRGVIVSESPPGVQPEPFRFPLRNRILAALCNVLVVVESRASGGSMITVDEAAKRGITVMAVPGSPHISPSEGTNALLRDGCPPVTCVDDVLVQLGLDNCMPEYSRENRPRPDARAVSILETMGDTPRTVDEIACLSGRSVVDVAVVLGQLESMGWVGHADGWWEALMR